MLIGKNQLIHDYYSSMYVMLSVCNTMRDASTCMNPSALLKVKQQCLYDSVLRTTFGVLLAGMAEAATACPTATGT